jgi:hypothetical protein
MMIPILWFLMGGLVSGFSIATQWLFVQRLNPGENPSVGWLFPVGMFLRFTVTGGLFLLSLSQGIMTAISFVMGLLVFRWGILFRLNSQQSQVEQRRLS